MTFNPDMVEFEIIGGARSVLGRKWRRTGGSESYARLYYVESGSGFIMHHGRRYALRRGYMYLIPAYSEFAYGCDRKIVISWLHFTSHMRNGADMFELVECPYEIRPGESRFVAVILKRILKLLANDTVWGEFERRACLLLLFSQFLRKAGVSSRAVAQDKMRRFAPVLEYIRSNLPRRITVRQMAAVAKMSPESFSRAFSKCFSTGPAEYVRRRKIGAARSLLADTDRKLGDIAGELGFTDAFHLSKTFRKLTGKSPTGFRKSRLEIVP